MMRLLEQASDIAAIVDASGCYSGAERRPHGVRVQPNSRSTSQPGIRSAPMRCSTCWQVQTGQNSGQHPSKSTIVAAQATNSNCAGRQLHNSQGKPRRRLRCSGTANAKP